jgi:FixJ family two-component response regulator
MNPMSEETVYLVDDDASVLKSSSRLLRAAGHRVETYDSAKLFLSQLSAGANGCVIIDLHMPGLDGLELQQALTERGLPLPVIFLTGAGDIPSSVRAMKGGAEDFLTKMAPREELLDAVKRALARGRKERLDQEHLQALRQRLKALSPREMEVFQQVVRGKLNKQIANALSINERTVKLHRTNLTRKLGVPSVAELTRLAKEAGLLEDT